MENIITKFEEKIITTSDLKLMSGKYLAKRLLRSWSEDFVDEDTSEVVSIERNELLLEKGTFLSADKISQINFYLQANDIKEVSISNQRRGSYMVKSHASVWLVTIELNGKNKNIYLYANALDCAFSIVNDFAEQTFSGVFKFKTIKELNYSSLLSNVIETSEHSEDDLYYKVEVEISDNEQENYTQSFILKASNAEHAKLNIIHFLTKHRSENGNSTPFDVTIISAKTIPCSDVIDVEFCKKYIENYQID